MKVWPSGGSEGFVSQWKGLLGCNHSLTLDLGVGYRGVHWIAINYVLNMFYEHDFLKKS